jgi:hypothetical protein
LDRNRYVLECIGNRLPITASDPREATMTIRWTVSTPQPRGKGWLIVVLVFGIVATAASFRWLATGSIEIEQTARAGSGAKPPPTAPQATGRPAGRITRDQLLFYPVCVTWIGLGLSMMTLSCIAFATSHEIFLRLSAYSCLAILLLAFATVGAALWSGP